MIPETTARPRPYTVEEFDDFVNRPENRNRSFEFIAGEIVEMVSNPLSSNIGSSVSGFIHIYLLQNDIGHLTGADGGYIVSGERYIPDVGFISYRKQPELSISEGYIPNPPDLAVEVLSPGNTDDEMAVKIANYLAAGTVIWMFKPIPEQVVVFQPGQPAQTLNREAVLDGGTVLPGFSLSLTAIFKKKA